MATPSIEDWKANYVASVKDVFQGIEERKLRSEEIVGLDRPYLRLRALQVKQEEDCHLPYSGSLLQEAEVGGSSEKYSPSTIQALYVPHQSGFLPKTVVVQGAAGSGKTLTCQKMVRDWACGDLYADRFDFVFYLSCRVINGITGDINLAGLISKTCNVHASEDLMKSILRDPSKVLMIFDGFDELTWSMEDDYEDHEDPFQELHRETLLKSLFRKQMLSEMSLLITTRTLCLQKLKDYVESQCTVEILGFTDGDLQGYISNFFRNQEAVEKALAVIRGREALAAMSSVPLLCRMLCTILKQGAEALDRCTTTTSVYLQYLKTSIGSSGGATAACIKKLCAIANEGVLSQKSLFDDGDLGRHEISLSDVESVFLNHNIFHRDSETGVYYSFGHLSIQEIFAALHYVLGEGDPVLPEVCKGGSLLDQSSDHPHLTLTVRFLYGLLGEEALGDFASRVGCKATLRAKPAMEKWLTGGKSGTFCSDALYCIYEMQDEAFFGRVMPQVDLDIIPGIYFGAMENISTRALSYFLANVKDYRSIRMEDYLLRPEDLAVLSPLLHRSTKLSFVRCGFPEDKATPGPDSWLCDTHSNIRELELQVCVFTASFFQYLRSFMSCNGAVTTLVLAYYKVTDPELKLLCDGLRHPGCTVQDLTLQDCDVTVTGCQELGAAIKTNRSLRKLDLSMNQLQDEGVRSLCEGLKDPDCTLHTLRLDYADVTPGCCDSLLSVLLLSRSLTALHVCNNDLQDSGVKRLCEGLQHPDCVLQELRLHESGLTSACCEDFLRVLLRNGSLRTLDLSYNNLEDAGAQRLCEGLRSPACRLQDLCLHHCGLTSASAHHLQSVLTTNRSLTKLDLAENSLTDAGVKALSAALSDPECVLRELSLYYCDLTSSSCEDLRSVITTSRSLTSLDVAGNQFQDGGMGLLCQGLRDPRCHLRQLRIGYCQLTGGCCDEILSALHVNRSLAELSVSMSLDEEQPGPEADAVWRRLEGPCCTVRKSETQDGTFVYVEYKRQD